LHELRRDELDQDRAAERAAMSKSTASKIQGVGKVS